MPPLGEDATDDWVPHIRDEDGNWVPVGSVIRSLNLAPALPPGQVLGVPVEQTQPGVYFIPDELLVRKGVVELWSFAQALADGFMQSNPGLVVIIERDVVRRGARFQVTRDGRAPQEDL